MGRPKGSNEASQMDKYESFKEAYGSLKKLFEDEAYIAAYVIAFSIMEDRLTAMYVVAQRCNGIADTDILKGYIPLSDKLKALLRLEHIEKHLYDDILKQANLRNQLFHAAMWRLEEFTEEAVASLIDVMKATDNARKAQKRKFGNGLNVKAAAVGTVISKE
jgi:hypothetical protein